jgi:hypothetical protein
MTPNDAARRRAYVRHAERVGTRSREYRPISPVLCAFAPLREPCSHASPQKGLSGRDARAPGRLPLAQFLAWTTAAI